MIEDPKAGIGTYQTYLAVRNHFKTGYDFFKYQGKVKVKEETYLKRNDKIFFQKVGKNYKKDLVNFFAANFVVNNEYIRDMAGKEGHEAYVDWTKRLESFEYYVREDVRRIIDSSESFFKNALRGPGHPLVLRMYLGGEIHIQTLCVLDSLTGFLDRIQSDPVTDEYVTFVRKATPFLKLNIKDMAKLVRKEIDNEQ